MIRVGAVSEGGMVRAGKFFWDVLLYASEESRPALKIMEGSDVVVLPVEMHAALQNRVVELENAIKAGEAAAKAQAKQDADPDCEYCDGKGLDGEARCQCIRPGALRHRIRAVERKLGEVRAAVRVILNVGELS